uniref:INO80 complex subunit D-like n=1 Tax=Dermatophagoides pteronyssinus TaxID=6956 RepID=A0A6P6XR24_DERPT|nr:INO80 complex subunit D-like [Dermatophagoides pteronyssinus]
MSNNNRNKQEYRKLQKEFLNIDHQCLNDIMEHFENDYQSTRKILIELYGTNNKNNDYDNDDNDSAFSSSIASSNDTIYLPITTEFFDNLHYLMETRNDLLNDTASTTIREDLRMKDTIYLPINMDLAYEIYWNLINYIQNTYDHLVTTATDFNNDDELCPLVDDDDHISEIMETEKAIQASRQEYLQNLIRKRQEYLHECNNENNNNNNNQSKIERQALLQEWLLEKKRDFLIKHFPGVDLLKLNRLFELNFFNLNETIKDIEAFYDCKLPLYYNKSLYSEVVKKPIKIVDNLMVKSTLTTVTANKKKKIKKKKKKKNKESPIKTINLVDVDQIFVSHDTDDNDDDDDNGDGDDNIKINDQQKFFAIIDEFLKQRHCYRLKLEHLQRKKIKFMKNGHKIIHRYHDEIRKVYQELRRLSEEIIDAYQNYDFNENIMDLHQLHMNEVRIIVPTILATKQQQLLVNNNNNNNNDDGEKKKISANNNDKLEFKIITGIGSGTIRRYLTNFIVKKKLEYRMTDGQGSFIITLYANNPIKFD